MAMRRSASRGKAASDIRTPIIALTANSVEKGLQDAMEAGMDLHLAKPIPKPRIAQIVLDLCNQVQN
ncbi:hypothetical protein ZWY2020_031728 [Hordeum vulgare]|nr:hypothetical protein ZWY2020_031728 [Hordeum vulgare]